MKSLLLAIMFGVFGFAPAQVAPAANATDQLRARAFAAVQAERTREKQALCPKSTNTLAINECSQRELGISDGNYGRLVRALGALLRSGSEAKGAPSRIPFDEAETAWSRYRDLACGADGAQYEGGTIRPSVEMGCQITLVRSHMEELWRLYSDLGTH